MLLITAILAVLASYTYGQHQFTVREGDKLCTPWIATNGGQVSLSYMPHGECVSPVAFESSSLAVRLCCQGMKAPVSSNNFPRECGKQKFEPSKQRIVGGVNANANSWPWQIRLHADGGGLCGGSLVDERHVITAAHCLRTPIVAGNYEVFVGLHDISKPVHSSQRIRAHKIFMHENYNPNTQENDIAVIRLSTPVSRSDTINFICLPGSEGVKVNDTFWVSGWGTTSFQGQVSPVLKQTAIHHMPHDCSRIYGRFDNNKQVCAGAHGGGRDTCQGDSGGPLMFEANGIWYLNGVVSYGHECARPGFPGVYARVSYYLPWINDKLKAA